MAIARVSVAEDKAALVRSLRSSEASTGPFKTYADVVTFAAVLGFRNSRKVSITGFSRREPDPIPQDQFRSPFIIELIAVADVQDPKILANNEESDRLRVEIFQQYANGGFEILQAELDGAVDYHERILLMLTKDDVNSVDDNEIDLSQFMGLN